MALPLLVIGAGVAAAFASNELTKQHHKRAGVIGTFPGECKVKVKPKSGAILCCGIYEWFEHSGIWVDDSIIERHGTGLIRGISPKRFLHNRSGNTIYVACDSANNPLCDETAVLRAASQLYQYHQYHLLDNNCNRFVAECLSGTSTPLTRFSELNYYLNAHFNATVHWLAADIEH